MRIDGRSPFRAECSRPLHARMAVCVPAVVTMSLSNLGRENWKDDGREAVGALLVSDMGLVQRLFDLPYTPQGADATGVAVYGADPAITDFALAAGDTDLSRWATFRVQVTAGPGLFAAGGAPPAHRTVVARMRVFLNRSATRRMMFIVPEARRRITAGPWEILEKHPA